MSLSTLLFIVNVTGVTLTMTNCTDINSVFINESTVPARTDAGWQSCTTNVGGITYTLPTVEGLHNLQVWTKDNVGNVQPTSATVAVYYDVTAPAIIVTTPPSLAGSNTYTINWTITEQYIDTTKSFTYDYWNGSSWINIGSQSVPVGPHSSASFSASWTPPALDRIDIKLRVKTTDLAGNAGLGASSSFEIDSTAPASTLDNPPTILRGGDTQPLNFTATDSNGIASLSFEYAADGVTFIQVTSTLTSPYSWTIPTDNVAAAKVRLVSTDPVGNQTIITTTPFQVDSTPPPAPAISLQTPIYTKVTGVAFTMAACDANNSEVLINTGAAPTDADPTWVTCNTTTGGITYTLPAVEGSHALSAWVRDAAKNISTTSTNFTVYYDVTAPALSVTNPGLLGGGKSYTINWTLTEQYINNTKSMVYDYWNGTTWVNIGSLAAGTGPLTNQAYSASWTTPALNRTDIKLRVTVTDLAGNTGTAQSTPFEIDSTFPTLTITSPANNSYAKNSVVLSGQCEGTLNINFTGDVAASFTIACSSGTYSQTVNFLNPGTDGPKVITIDQSDPAGNKTTVSVTVINDNLPPVLTRTSPTSPILTNTNSVTWTGTCEGTYTISVTGNATQSFPCSSGSWSWTTPTITTDATYNFSLSQTDAAGNVSTALPLQWTRDQTPPIFNHNRTSPETNNKSSLVFSGQCEGTNAIAITGAFTNTMSCSSGSWTWTTPTVSVDQTYIFTFTQTDQAGNQSVINHSWTRDTSGPQILIDLSKELIKTNTNTVTITGTCDMSITTTTITITGTDSTTTTCNSGTFSYTTVSQITNTTRTYNFAQTNSLGTTTTVSSTWIRETTLPTISSFAKDSTVLEPSTTNFILTDMSASSANPNVGIAEFCYLSNITTQPVASDKCWVKVNSPIVGLTIQQNITLNNYSNLLGWQPVLYSVYAFVKDEAGNISALSNAGSGTMGVDKYQSTYDPGIPPVLSNVIAANIDTTANPPTLSENSVPAGSDVYIRWKATDNTALPSGAITLSYTQDEINFVPITLTNPADPYNTAANLTGLDNANYGCPSIVLGANEGCYKWTGGSPLNSSYKIQVTVLDYTQLAVKFISNPLNTGSIKLIAGNTESGLGGSAMAAMFYTRNTTWEIDPKSLV